MELNQVAIIDGEVEAWVPWKGDIRVKLVYIPHKTDRELLKKTTRAQFKGHQRVENEVDLVALRDYYCKHIIKGMKGLTIDGQPFEPAEMDFRKIWDGSSDFGIFCTEACRDISNFVEEKKT